MADWNDELAQLAQDVTDTFPTVVTVRARTPGVFSDGSGMTAGGSRANTTVDTVVNAHREAIFAVGLAGGGSGAGGRARSEGVRYSVAAADLAGILPHECSSVIDAGVERAVARAHTHGDGAWFVLECRSGPT